MIRADIMRQMDALIIESERNAGVQSPATARGNPFDEDCYDIVPVEEGYGGIAWDAENDATQQATPRPSTAKPKGQTTHASPEPEPTAKTAPNFLKYKEPLNVRIATPPCRRIAKIFPTGYLSFIVAPPSAGKSFLTLKLCCDMSIGGSILEGKSSSEGFTANLCFEDEPIKTLILAGESGAARLVERLRLTGWSYDDRYMDVFDARKARLEGLNLLLNTVQGQEGFKQLIDDGNPQLIFVDSLMSFNGVDESKGADMRDVLSFLEGEAYRRNISVVCNHHVRKSLNAKMRNLPQNMDEAIGSSMISRYCALMMGLQPQASDGTDEENAPIMVRCLKSWDRKFKPFSFTFGDNEMTFDHSPITGSKDASAAGVLELVEENFSPSEEFSRAQLEEMLEFEEISSATLRRRLNELVEGGRLIESGGKRNRTYKRIQTMSERISELQNGGDGQQNLL